MTTVTVIVGDKESGRSLVGAAIASYIRTTKNKSTYALNGQTKLRPLNFNPDRLDDLILVSSSDRIEPWMEKWFERFGNPLFTIMIRRHDNG